MDFDVFVTSHLIVTTIAYGIASGYSLAHKFYVGVWIGVLAIVHAWLLAIYGITSATILAQQPLTVVFAWFIVTAAQRNETLERIVNGDHHK